ATHPMATPARSPPHGNQGRAASLVAGLCIESAARVSEEYDTSQAAQVRSRGARPDSPGR
ncbi:MAG: hypothetical protein KAI41_05910, partial [Hyphomicrobiaceae bacterium]|nr:hypothetical protein [Hyphomicrobiaceae bacterium]